MRTLRMHFALWFVAIACSISAHAQAPLARSVTIYVSDLSGAAVPKATVHVAPGSPSAPGQMETDQAGESHLQLAPRVYEITVSAPGFKTTKQLVRVTETPDPKASAQMVSIILDLGSMSGPIVAYPASSLVIDGGSFDKKNAYSPSEFAALPHVSLTVHNAHSNADETYSGVPLATLLPKVGAPLGKDLRGEAMSRYLLATGSDGYSVVLSLAEVDPGFHAGQVLVADTRDGKPLGDHGPFQLIVSDDKRPARWVHNLTSIALSNAH